MRQAYLVLGVLLLASAAFAGCASDAYRKTCAGCQFDEQGRIDQGCSKANQAAGTACVSVSYPIMAAKYAEGKCPQLDACGEELRGCTAQYSSGDDRADCTEGSVGVCDSAADACVRNAALKCGEIEAQCPASAAALAMILAGAVFLRRA